MRDFYAASAPVPLDQAQGLRRRFSGRTRQVIGLAANPHVAFGAIVLDRIAATLACLGRQVLVVDAAASAPLPHEFAHLELAAGVEPMMPGVAYLPARGLPLAYVDTRGSAARFIDALFDAAPSTDVLLLHAEPGELARALMRRAVRPLVMAADHPESLKHAYAACKLLSQRTGLATFDLLLSASTRSPRVQSIVTSLSGCADSFLGVLLHQWALVDPAGTEPAGDEALTRLLAAQLAMPIEHEPEPEPRLESSSVPFGSRFESRFDPLPDAATPARAALQT